MLSARSMLQKHLPSLQIALLQSSICTFWAGAGRFCGEKRGGGRMSFTRSGLCPAPGWLSLCGVLSSLEQQESKQTATKILAILPSLTSAQGRNKALSNSVWARKNPGKKTSCLPEKDRVGNCWYAQELPTPENNSPFHWSLLPLHFTPKTVLLYQLVCSVLNWLHINMFIWESKCVWSEVCTYVQTGLIPCSSNHIPSFSQGWRL